MSKTLGTNLSTARDNVDSGNDWRHTYLVSISDGASTVYYSDSDDVTFGGDTYTHRAFTISGLSGPNDASQRCSIKFVDDDDIVKAFILANSASTKYTVRIFVTVGGITPSTNDVLELFNGFKDVETISNGAITLQCRSLDDREHVPRIFCTADEGYNNNTPPGPVTIGTQSEIMRQFR